MLQGIRDSAQGWIAWVIVILITIPFALWGIQEYFGVDPNIAVADVNGTEIPLSEFQIALQRRQQALAGSPLAPEEGQVKTDTIEGLIEDQLLLQAGDSEGLRISDELLASAITTNPSFVIDGRFDQAAYDSFVARAGFSPGRFEETLRQNMLTQQLASAYAIAAVATEDEVSRLRGLQTQKRRYREMIVRSEDFLGSAVSDDSISKYYEANRARYVTEEEVQVQYLLLERSALEASITADDETLRSEYDNRIASFTQPEQRRASHILVAVNDSVDDAAALARINAAKAALDAGGEFAEVAKEYSEDPGSAEKGGDLGFFGKGLMDPAFEEAAFSAARDVIGEPVRSSFGYHLIKVTDVRAARVKAFEEAREQVLREVQRLQGEQLYFEQVENLSNLAFEHPDNLEVAAETLGLKLHTTGFFSRSGLTDDVLFSDPKVVEAAFAPEVREEGNNSDPIEIDGNRVVVLRVIEDRPSEQRSLEDARGEIVEALEEDAARAKAYEDGKALLAKLRGGATPASVEDGEARVWSAEKEASRTAFDIPEAIRTALFRMRHPSEGDVVYDASVDNEGNFRILRLLAVENGADDGVEEAQLKLARQGLARLTGRSTYRAFVDALKAEASIEIYTERL